MSTAGDILAIETSTERASVAVWRAGGVVFEAAFESDRAHNSMIFARVQEALEAGRDWALVVVGTGPGAYSGIRVGLATGLGVSLAKGVPLVGVSSLTAFGGPERYQIVGDARRGVSFFAEVVAGRLLAEPELVDSAALPARLGGQVFTLDSVPTFPGVTCVTPTASALAVLAARLTAEEIRELSAKTPEPLYLRAPFITQPTRAGKMVTAQ